MSVMVSCKKENGKLNTVKGCEPEGVRSNELGSHTAPVAATHHSDFGFVRHFIVSDAVEGYSSFFAWDLQGWSHEYRKKERVAREKEREKWGTHRLLLMGGREKYEGRREEREERKYKE